MAPRSKPDDPFGDDDWGPSDGSTTASNEMPEGTTDPDRASFLKPFHVVKSGRTGSLELISASGPSEYSDCVLHVKFNGVPFRMGLRTFDPGYIALRAKFGKNREDWHGKLKYKIMPHKGNPDGYVAVRPA